MKRSARHRRNAKALAKTLIATTLTAGTAGTAGAAPVEESSVGGDFENLFQDANLLTGGTDEVTGENMMANFQFGAGLLQVLRPRAERRVHAECRVDWRGLHERQRPRQFRRTPLDSAESELYELLTLTRLPDWIDPRRRDADLRGQRRGRGQLQGHAQRPAVGSRPRTIDACTGRARGGPDRGLRSASAQGSRRHDELDES